MTSLSHSVPAPMRSPWSFMGSLCLHAWVLAWVALAPGISLERPKSLYQREIQPGEKHIVWYKLSDRLPDVSQPEARRDARPLRARTRFNQNVVAGPLDNSRPPQLILAPAPEINLSRPLPLPNIVALTPVRPPALPFIAPPVKPRAPSSAPSLPEAPKFAAATLDVKAPAVDPMAPPPVRRFTPPKEPKLPLPAEPSPLPAAPELVSTYPNMSVPAALLSRQHTFVPPARQLAAPGDPATIEALPPAIAAPTTMLSESSLVIAGLDPAKSVEVPAPPGSVKAGFSGGPKPQPKGAEGTPSGGLLEIPSLTIQGGATNPKLPVMVARVSPTSPEGLAAAMRAARGMAPPSGGSAHPAVRVSTVPDPRMYGRQVYTMALQIPNLTSYSGSWLVWFASHEPDIGNPGVDLHPPLPLHMVSPRYIRSAVEDRVEGKVRLWAVISKDGHVGDISLLQHLDDRLDRSAEEALGKWLFEPAVRNGVVVDVDAVFEIPFNLAPKNDR